MCLSQEMAQLFHRTMPGPDTQSGEPGPLPWTPSTQPYSGQIVQLFSQQSTKMNFGTLTLSRPTQWRVANLPETSQGRSHRVVPVSSLPLPKELSGKSRIQFLAKQSGTASPVPDQAWALPYLDVNL